jgi:predicted nucleic acid-binding Zn ribbon protein
MSKRIYHICLCKQCSKEYLPTGSRQKYCADCCSVISKNRCQNIHARLYDHKCLQCGKAFTSKQRNAKYCGHECHHIATRSLKNMTCVCVVCGETFVPKQKGQKCCSHECAKVLSIETLTKKYGTPVDPCPNCGKAVRHVMQKHGHRQVFCSVECAKEYRRKQGSILKTEHSIEKKAQHERALIKTCIVCEKQFKATNANQQICSDECRRVFASEHYGKDYWFKQGKSKHIASSYRCKECGNMFTPEYGDRRRVFCSDECRKTWKSRHKNPVAVRAENSRRRAHLAGADVGQFRDVDIFERDHWTCAICGQPVDREPSFFYNLLAASLDHIVPLSRGGSHTTDNVRCVHFICNSLKSDADDIVAKERARRWFKKQMTGHAVVMQGGGGSKGCGNAPSRSAGGHARANADGRFSKVCGKMR